MVLRKLTPKEEAIFDLIIEQRKQSHRDDDFLIYDVNHGQETLITNGNAEKYGIGLKQQHEIVDKLIKDNFLDAELIVEPVLYDSRGVKVARHPSGLTWKKYNISRMLISDEDCKDSYFVKIGFDWIKKVNDACRARFLCKLSYDDANCCFIVECNNKKYVVDRIAKNGRPFAILKYALEKYPKPVTRTELNRRKDEDILHVGNKESIATMVVPPNNIIHHELKPFIEDINSKTLRIKPITKLTLDELRKIARR